MTKTEKERMDAAREQVTALINDLRDSGATMVDKDGQEVSESRANVMQAEMIGQPLAMMDALFAIRDGEPWRGMTDHQKIAFTILREVGMGDKD